MRYLFSVFAILFASLATAAGPLSLETCQMCHEDTVNAFLQSAHGQAISAQSPDLLSSACVRCHQASEEHIDDPSPSNVTRKPTDEACNSCHADKGERMGLMVPAHQRHGIGCQSCHNVAHSDGDEAVLPVVNQRCVSCHPSETARFELPYAHREGTKAAACTNCHSMHATSRLGRMSLEDDGAPCVVCHSEKRLPFVFPHPPDDRRGCLSCHTPHGSPNPHQLTRNSVMSLCLECHSQIPASHDPSSARYRNCTQCHTAIHGSNRDPRLFRN